MEMSVNQAGRYAPAAPCIDFTYAWFAGLYKTFCKRGSSVTLVVKAMSCMPCCSMEPLCVRIWPTVSSSTILKTLQFRVLPVHVMLCVVAPESVRDCVLLLYHH